MTKQSKVNLRQSDFSTFIETEAYCTLIYILISYLPLFSLEYKNK